MANKSIEIEPFKKLISDYKSLDPIPERETTIFEISGYPHFEEVISNVLAFFFRDDAKHPFSLILVDALLAAANTFNEDKVPSDFSVEEVEREALTNSGNRIDLVIKTDTLCIAIENKIYADLYNNLNDYQNFIKGQYPEHKPIFIVLSLREIDRASDWEAHEFTFVTYQNYFRELEDRLGSVLLNADTKFVVYLSDLIKTLRHMSESTQLTSEFLDFLEDNRSEIESLYDNAFKKFKDEAKSKADRIESLVTLENTGFKTYNYNPANQLKFVRIFDKTVKWGDNELNVKIKLRFAPVKCTLEVWTGNDADTMIFQDYISQLFEKDFTDWETHPDSKNESIEYSKFEFGPGPKEVSKVAGQIDHLIAKINATSKKSK